ncbi:MAG TPA: protoporphyrinogen oxidase [Polyangiaceae bacterium]
MRTARRVVVVGGGIAGLAAARAALARGRELGREVLVTVLERSGRLGGNVFTERVDGFVLDGGPDSWVVTKPQASALARDLGLGGSLVGTQEGNRRYYIAWGDRLHPVPEGLVLGVPTRIAPLARSSLFSWRAKLRMGLEPLVRARRFEGDDDESIGDFARRRLGREAAERLVAPLLGGISAGDASEISVRASFPQLVAMEREHGSLVRGMLAARRAREGNGHARGKASSAFVSLEQGVGELPRALAERLRADGATLRTGAAVEALSRGDQEWSLTLGGGERLEADAVLLAVPGHVAARLAGALDAELARLFGTIRYGSTATVFLGYRRVDVAHPLDGVGFVVPRAAGRPILAGTWVSSKWEHRAPEGSVLLRVFLGGASGESVLGQDDPSLVRLARGELRALMGIDAEPTLARVFRFDHASAQMRVGHLATMRAIHQRLAAVAPGLGIAGGGYDGVGIPDCIRQGEEAGRALVG